MSTFWFEKELPAGYAAPIVKNQLSYNGQLHFRCRSCNEVSWFDETFGRMLLEIISKGIENNVFSCPNCKKSNFESICFTAFESRLCNKCGAHSFASGSDPFECETCQSNSYIVEKTTIRPPYPKRLFTPLRPKIPFGDSPEDDVQFLIDHLPVLRMVPNFYCTYIHFVSFIESIFEHVHGSSAEATDLLNIASSMMRKVYKDTKDLDAAYLAISLMMLARQVCEDPIKRAVYGFNISQNIYSALAQREEEYLSLRFGFDLREFGIGLSYQTLSELEVLNEDFLQELKAEQKWLLGDMLKSCDPSESEIIESLKWFDAALQDPQLPSKFADFVREGAFTAHQKRRNLNAEEKNKIHSNLEELAKQNLNRVSGLQKFNHLSTLLRNEATNGPSKAWKNIALRCFGDTILYTASNNPNRMLRTAGSFLSSLVAGFAAERFGSKLPLVGIAGVEAFRSLAINNGNIFKDNGHHIDRLEIALKILNGEVLAPEEPINTVQIAQALLEQHTKLLEENIKQVLKSDPERFIFWFDIYEDFLIKAVITLHKNKLVIKDISNREHNYTKLTDQLLPMANDPPGRFRAQRVHQALTNGVEILSDELQRLTGKTVVIVGSSFLGGYPFDAEEVIKLDQAQNVRPMIFSPSIAIAAETSLKKRSLKDARVLVVSYGGDDLPGVRRELEYIINFYGKEKTKHLAGDITSKTELLDTLTEDFGLIHFCGHGTFDILKPMQSRLYYNHLSSSDSFITADDILQLGKIGHDPVVVLSACNSAVVMPNRANNFRGFAGALLRTGATSIVGSRWPVSDSICADFSKHLHYQLSQGESVAKGVAYAKNMLRNTRIDEWAAFMSIGG